MRMLKCPLCQNNLKITYTQTIAQLIDKNVWSTQSNTTVAENLIKRREKQAIERDFSLNKEYHVWICFECGYKHNGIENVKHLF